MSVKGSTIAVIDDDLRVLESLVNLLASFVYKQKATNLQNNSWDHGTLSRTSCIITDVEMRQMSGLGPLQFLNNSSSAEML